MIDWFVGLDIKIQVVIISSITSLIVLLLGWLFKFLYERFSLSYKLKKEFQFEQKKRLKEEIAKNKTHLLNSVEALNHRLWNFTQNVNEGWHNVSEIEWFKKKDQYYINSFVYRFLCFIHWTIKTEKDTITVDTTIANKEDIRYLKWIKTFKDIFTDADLLQELGYDKAHDTNHFYKNDLIGYSKWIIENNQVIDFDDFKEKLKNNYKSLKPVIEYFSTIKDDDKDKNLNVLRCFHLLSIKFLNEYGHDYQITPKEKLNRITKMYKSKIKIKQGFSEFIAKSKLEKEMKDILKKIK